MVLPKWDVMCPERPRLFLIDHGGTMETYRVGIQARHPDAPVAGETADSDDLDSKSCGHISRRTKKVPNHPVKVSRRVVRTEGTIR